MNFRIADTFTDSLTRLTNAEQKAVKTTAFDLQLNPANPGMQFHKLERAKYRQFWSLRDSTEAERDAPESGAVQLMEVERTQTAPRRNVAPKPPLRTDVAPTRRFGAGGDPFARPDAQRCTA